MKKRSILCFAGLLCAATIAHAWVGGPTSNNSFNQNGSTAGTYQGVITGKNIVGVMILGSADTQKWNDTGLQQTTGSGSNQQTNQLFDLTSNEGRFAIFVDGTVVTGMATASINLPERNITAVLEGSKDRGTKVVQKEIVTTVPNITTNTDADGLTTKTEAPPQIKTETKSFTLNDIFYVSANFKAKIGRTFPALSFEGKGTLDVKDPTGIEIVQYDVDDPQLFEGGTRVNGTYWSISPEIDETEIGIRVYGVKTSSESPFFYAPVSVQYPSVTVN